MKTVKVTEQTHKRLLVMEILQAQNGRRKTLEDAVLFLPDENDRNNEQKRKESEHSAAFG